MAIPSAGQISLSNIQSEYGGGAPIGINEYYAGGSYVPGGTSGNLGSIPYSGTISFNHFRGSQKCPAYGTPLYYFCDGSTLMVEQASGYCGSFSSPYQPISPSCVPAPPPPPACDGYGTFYGYFCSGLHLYALYADGGCGTFSQIVEYWSASCAPAPPPPPPPPPPAGPPNISYSASRSGFVSQNVTFSASISPPASYPISVNYSAISNQGGNSAYGGFTIPAGSSSGSETLGPYGWAVTYPDFPLNFSYTAYFSASGAEPSSGTANFTIWA